MAPPGRRPAGPQKGGRKGDVYRIGGVDLPWDPELDLDKPKPTPLFPAYRPDMPRPLTAKEKSQFAHFKALRESIHNGPLYTVLKGNARVSKRGAKSGVLSTFDAFESMPRYSQKYSKKKHATPRLDTRPYVLKFFPRELWSTLDPGYKERDGVVESSTRGKSLQIPGYKAAANSNPLDNELEDEEVEEKAAGDMDDEVGSAAEEEDDQFDDEEDGGDYHAEGYFEGGEDEADDFYDAGDDGGLDYF